MAKKPITWAARRRRSRRIDAERRADEGQARAATDRPAHRFHNTTIVGPGTPNTFGIGIDGPINVEFDELTMRNVARPAENRGGSLRVRNADIKRTASDQDDEAGANDASGDGAP